MQFKFWDHRKRDNPFLKYVMHINEKAMEAIGKKKKKKAQQMTPGTMPNLRQGNFWRNS